MPSHTLGADFLYEAAETKLHRQDAFLDSLRSRAAMLVSAASLSVSFLGGALIRDRSTGGLGWLFWLGAGFFVLGLVLDALVFLPRGNWVFALDPVKVRDDWLGQPKDESRLAIADFMIGWIAGNDRQLTFLHRMFTASTVALGAAFAAWLVEIGLS